MNAIGAYGYALVGVLYFLFTVLLLTAWRGRRVGIYLIAASLVSVVWSGTLALHASGSAVSPMILFVVEVFRFGAWIAFIGRLLIEVGASPAIRNGANAIWLTVLIAGPAYAIAAKEVGIRSELGLALIWGGLLTALTSLVLIEQLYRNASQGARWSPSTWSLTPFNSTLTP